MEGTTSINSLPNELYKSNNVVLNIKEKQPEKHVTFNTPPVAADPSKERCNVCTLPRSQCAPTCRGRQPVVPTQLSQESISQIVSGLKEAGGMTALPSRDIPMDQNRIVQDEQIQREYVSNEPENKYIDEDTNFHALLERSKKAEKEQATLDIIYRELQTPILVMLLFFIFQLPFIKNLMAKNMKFFYKKDGNENLYGFLFKTLLFGVTFWGFNKGMMHL